MAEPPPKKARAPASVCEEAVVRVAAARVFAISVEALMKQLPAFGKSRVGLEWSGSRPPCGPAKRSRRLELLPGSGRR